LILYRHKRWRLDSDGHGWFWLSDTPEKPGSITWGNACPRMVAWGRFFNEKAGRGLYVFNTHFDHVSELSRQKGAELLARVVKQAKTEPVVVLGDFNAGESSEAISYLLGKKGESPVKLIDTFRAVHPDEKHVGTFHDFRGGTEGDKIDFILATPGVKVLSAAIVHDRISGEAKDARYLSDHYPVTAEMTFPDSFSTNAR
jgi:endonuclease/exonuclease/phosphatase family metal-dependent hydrolase